MRAIVVDGLDPELEPAGALRISLDAALSARGFAVERWNLSELDVPPCKGDFGCWTVTPGSCVQPGPHRGFADALARGELVVFLTHVTFGGYGARLKRLLDHGIPAVSPLIVSMDGQSRHPPRAARPANLLVLALAARADDLAARVFERLALRTALNLSAPHLAVGVATPGDLPDLDRWVAERLERVLASPAPRPGGAPLDLSPAELPPVPPRHATLLVGSPRGRASVSLTLARRLGGALTARGVETVTMDLHRELAADPALAQVLAVLERTDLLAIVAPLYADSLPAPVTQGLEVLAPALRRTRRRVRCLAVVNSGFPEPVHSETALAICRCFAAESGVDWVGGLGIGEGGMVVPGAPLRGRLGRALDQTADALARGEVVPRSALELVRRLTLPPWLYRRIANWSFRREARRHGVHLGRSGLGAPASQMAPPGDQV